MIKANLYNMDGVSVGEVVLPEEIFGLDINHDLIHQVSVAQDISSRAPIAHTKGRSEVRGGGKKPWRQKGTGRARHSSIRSPIWKGGAVTFGPTKHRNFTKAVTKKMKRKALFMTLSSKVADGSYIVVDRIAMSEPKTGKLKEAMKKITANIPKYKQGDNILIVMPQKDRILEKSAGNVPYIRTLVANSLNARDILANKYLILAEQAIDEIKKTFIN